MPDLSKKIFHGWGGDEIFDYYITYCISPNIEGMFPIYFHNKPILPNCEANIARLA